MSKGPRYTLDQLLAESDYSQPRSAEDQAWLDMAPVGREMLPPYAATNAEILQYRATLALAVKDHVTHAGLTSDRAARLFGVDCDRMFDLLGGRIADFEFGDLVQMMNEADLVLPPLGATGIVAFPKTRLDRAVALTEGMTVNLDDEIEGDVSI